MIKVGLLVVAGGRGSRLGADRPKQYLDCAGRPLLVHTLEALAASFPFRRVKVVIHPDDRALYDQTIAHLTPGAAAALGAPAIGGATRQQSVLAGLEALDAAKPDIVLIHDAARPFPSAALIGRAIEAAERHGAAAPGTAMSDTVKQVDSDGRVLATPPRSTLEGRADAAGLPLSPDPRGASARRRGRRRRPHRRRRGRRMGGRAGLRVRRRSLQPQGDHHAGPDAAEARLDGRARARRGSARASTSTPSRPATPCGSAAFAFPIRAAQRPFRRRRRLHALADALYGALAEGDIGQHFPPSDPQWKGAASKIFLAHAAERVRARGGAIVHLDATLICEAPKIGPHREAMRARIAEIAGRRCRPGRGQGDDQREARLHRPRRGHRLPRDRDGAAALDRRLRSANRAPRIRDPIWVFLARRRFAAKILNFGVGFPWISLDVTTRIETYEWVIRDFRSKFLPRAFSEGRYAEPRARIFQRRKGRLGHGATLTHFLIFCNRVHALIALAVGARRIAVRRRRGRACPRDKPGHDRERGSGTATGRPDRRPTLRATLPSGPRCFSRLVVDLLQPVDRRRDTLEARLQLQRQELRIVARLVQVAAVEPQAPPAASASTRCAARPPTGPGSFMVSEPRPQTLPTLSAISWPQMSATQPFIEP